jgi:NADPH:quinone reductase-like Zn-dependent oxidoreductase
MPNAIRFHKSGGPEVLVSEPVPIGKPGPGEARVRHTAVGVNFVDIYIRTGLYPTALPSGLGTEAAGVVEDVGPGVDYIKAGDRVAYAGGPLGAYSEVRVMPADRLVALPQVSRTSRPVFEHHRRCCCARAASGHATAAPPSSVMKSRRFTARCLPCFRQKE